MITEKIHRNIEQLPDYLQIEVSDFIEYLLIKYQIQSELEDIPEGHKQILKERHKKIQTDIPESWESVKNELLQKYAI